MSYNNLLLDALQVFSNKHKVTFVLVYEEYTNDNGVTYETASIVLEQDIGWKTLITDLTLDILGENGFGVDYNVELGGLHPLIVHSKYGETFLIIDLFERGGSFSSFKDFLKLDPESVVDGTGFTKTLVFGPKEEELCIEKQPKTFSQSFKSFLTKIKSVFTSNTEK